MEDFIKVDKKELTKFLVNFLNEPDWGEDRDVFARLLDIFFDLIKNSTSKQFYIIDFLRKQLKVVSCRA